MHDEINTKYQKIRREKKCCLLFFLAGNFFWSERSEPSWLGSTAQRARRSVTVLERCTTVYQPIGQRRSAAYHNCSNACWPVLAHNVVASTHEHDRVIGICP